MYIFRRAWARYLTCSNRTQNRLERGSLLALGAFATLLLTAFTFQVFISPDPAQAKPAPPAPATITCPKGFFPREVRVPGQRLESDPRPSLNPVVIQNNEPGDIRYVVALTCVRPWNNAEQQEYWKAVTGG